MESTLVKQKECNSAATAPTSVSICNSDSFVHLPSGQEFPCTNSNELNAAASLSDDSGVPLTANSSISSGDSYRMGFCKLDMEVMESDGDLSQIESLDNCSVGGMSAENFNTLKKGPMFPIDPPPEFQDSPKTTLVRAKWKNRGGSMRRWTTSQSSFEHLTDKMESLTAHMRTVSAGTSDAPLAAKAIQEHETTEKEMYTITKPIYSSDSILNSHMDNVYDEPNSVLSSSLGNSVDVVEYDNQQKFPPNLLPVSIVKLNHKRFPHFADQSRYFKAIPSEQDHFTSDGHKAVFGDLSEILDYDLYYGMKRGAHQLQEPQQSRKMLHSPSNNSRNCRSSIYNGVCCNRPNSRNSLNSRLSSSHNSLSVTSANKPDDSIFITQAMSHDALLSREMSDFYTVPMDSDIYALPIDMIKNDTQSQNPVHLLEFASSRHNDSAVAEDCKRHGTKHQYQLKNGRRNNHKRKKRINNKCLESGVLSDLSSTNRIPHTPPSDNRSTLLMSHADLLGNMNTNEQFRMSLNEVKQFYHSLYSDAQTAHMDRVCTKLPVKTTAINVPSGVYSEEGWKEHLGPTNSNNGSVFSERTEQLVACLGKTLSQSKLSSDSEVHNNNNVLVAVNNKSNRKQNGLQQQIMHGGLTSERERATHIEKSFLKTNKLPAAEKKTLFTLNLKQRFCSIFRFRRNQSHCNNRSASFEATSGNDKFATGLKCNEAKRRKFQSRALPPLPKKDAVVLPNEGETEKEEEKIQKSEGRLFQFTSSIEKVKDYGWYWGPLSSEAAEKVLSNEPDGSFIVRDSSDDHYIFSLSFKLNNCVRHVRIEQDQGTFSFGSYAKFKSQTITEFIEKAVEHSRSGRYLFFLHRRPEHGPMRVQLTNPVSRFKHVQSLQHMCRFVILKVVIRKDLIQTLPLPRRLLDYLNYKHCYSEQIESDSANSQVSEDSM